MRIEDFLSRLQKVRKAGPGRWVACCPAHEDKNPSLTVRELEDGRILIHCFPGCGVDEVVGAVGLTVSDLFPEKPIENARPLRKPFPAEDVIAAMELEVQIVVLCAADIAEGKTLSDVDLARLIVAKKRLEEARRMALGIR